MTGTLLIRPVGEDEREAWNPLWADYLSFYKTALTRDIMTLQAEGDYAKAKDLVDRLGIVRPEVKKVLDRLAAIPVDIEPRFTTAAQLSEK